MSTIYVCANTETLLDGQDIDSALQEPIAAAAVAAGVAAASDAGYDPRVEHMYHDWHGGRFSSYQCGRIIDGVRWGYCARFAATLMRAPSPQLIAAVEAVSDAMAQEIDDLAEAERAEAAAWKAECEAEDAQS